MADKYPSTPPKLTQQPIGAEVFTLIGRLVRAVADVENYVTLYIIKLTNLTESQAMVMLGKLSLSGRIGVAERLAALVSEPEKDLCKAAFRFDLSKVIECRNFLAHGIYLGTDSKGQYFFRSDRESEIRPGALSVAVTGYTEASIREHTEAVERHRPALVEHLQLETMLAVRQETPLAPHKRSRKGKPYAKPA